MHRARPSAIDVNVIGTKGCHFKLEAVFHNEDHPKMRANRIRAWKNFLHSFRLGVGGDIEVFRSFAADDVAHAASGEIRNMTALAQTRGNFPRRLFHRRSSFHLGRMVTRPLNYLASADELSQSPLAGEAALLLCQNE